MAVCLRRFGFAFVLLTASLFPAAAKQTKQDPVPKLDPMRIVIVRSNSRSCEPHCAEWIAAQGDITPQTPGLLRRVLKLAGKRNLPIFLHSRGGRVEAGIAMGRLIRAHHLEVTVSQTDIDPCDVTDKKCSDGSLTGRTGAPRSFRSFCASSCAFVLAAGEKRHVTYLAYVGVHQFTYQVTQIRRMRYYSVRHMLINGEPVETRRTLVREKILSSVTKKEETPRSEYDLAAHYFHDMGIADNINTILQNTSPDNIHFLSPDELRSTAMMTDRLSSEEQISTLDRPENTEPVSAPPGITDRNWGPVDATMAVGSYKANEIFLHLRFVREQANANIVKAEMKFNSRLAAVPIEALTASLSIAGHPALNGALRQVANAKSLVEAGIPIGTFCDLRHDDFFRVDVAPQTLDSNIAGGSLRVQTRNFEGLQSMLSGVCPQ